MMDYRSKIIAFMTALGMLPSTAASENDIENAHNALEIAVLGTTDRQAADLTVEGAQQFLYKQKVFVGPLNGIWSTNFQTSLDSYFGPLKSTGEFPLMQKLMLDRLVGLLRDGWVQTVSTQHSSKRLIGDATDAFAARVKWRIELLNSSFETEYDTHAPLGATAFTKRNYKSMPEATLAATTGSAWVARKANDYGVNETALYLIARTPFHTPYAYVLFSRPMQNK